MIIISSSNYWRKFQTTLLGSLLCRTSTILLLLQLQLLLLLAKFDHGYRFGRIAIIPSIHGADWDIHMSTIRFGLRRQLQARWSHASGSKILQYFACRIFRIALAGVVGDFEEHVLAGHVPQLIWIDVILYFFEWVEAVSFLHSVPPCGSCLSLLFHDVYGFQPFAQVRGDCLIIIRRIPNTIACCQQHSIRLIHHLGRNDTRTIQQFKLLSEMFRPRRSGCLGFVIGSDTNPLQ
mmetsp:Transcript_13254/g.38197  ORF Transcript_13254/g.38197 Transcript_13254/m.38197 type:complete len:235 (-) Transcript_13254:57-761(-)